MKKTSRKSSNPTKSSIKESLPDMSTLTAEERFFKIYGKRLSNAKVGTAFMTFYQKPKDETKNSS